MSPSRRRLLAVSVLLVFLLPGVVAQAPNICGTEANGRYACPDCSSTSASTNRGTAFEANLLSFRDSLLGMAATNASFLNATFAGAGGVEEQGETVYGLATCFADAEMSDCSACLAGAAAEVPSTRCGGRRDMVLWYARCLVRYANASFFGVADTSPAQRFDVPNPNNFSDAAALGKARERLAGRMLAAAAESPARFAFDDEAVTGNTTVYGLAQCTEDLPVAECTRCLASHMVWFGVCCADMDGARLVGPSCYLRYELMAFAPSMEPLLEQPPSSSPSAPGGASSSSSSSSSGKKTYYVVAGALGGACVLLVGACLLLLWLKKKKRRGSSSNGMESVLMQQYHPRRYSYAEVKRMTGSLGHKLGQGGNGTVYKGRLPDGREVAVKMLKEAKVDGEEFVNEVASISRTSHVNVVTLLGFCMEGSSNSKRRGLVYEYMPNGSLEKYSAGGSMAMSWEQLLDVAVGIARGLEYLHRGCNAHIVHFDIKPHNILLDAAFRPKISDFGLAKLCPQKESTISVSIAGARGTVGYIAPEVFSRHAGASSVTSKSDVYSYGMMVLEMVGARRTVTVSSESSGASTTRLYFPECLYHDLDGFCASACGSEETVRKMVIVGLWCIQMSPSDRPSMSRVVDMLEKTTAAELQLPSDPSAS